MGRSYFICLKIVNWEQAEVFQMEVKLLSPYFLFCLSLAVLLYLSNRDFNLFW